LRCLDATSQLMQTLDECSNMAATQFAAFSSPAPRRAASPPSAPLQVGLAQGMNFACFGLIV
jgi:hypothetical protein